MYALPLSRRLGTRLVALVGAATLSAGGWIVAQAADTSVSSQRERQNPAAVATIAEPDSRAISTATRKSYEDFWKMLPPEKATGLERQLDQLEARQRGGDNVERDLDALRRTYPEFFKLSSTLKGERWVAAGAGGTQASTLECTGIGWIGKNGKLRCIGKLVVRS